MVYFRVRELLLHRTKGLHCNRCRCVDGPRLQSNVGSQSGWTGRPAAELTGAHVDDLVRCVRELHGFWICCSASVPHALGPRSPHRPGHIQAKDSCRFAGSDDVFGPEVAPPGNCIWPLSTPGRHSQVHAAQYAIDDDRQVVHDHLLVRPARMLAAIMIHVQV